MYLNDFLKSLDIIKKNKLKCLLISVLDFLLIVLLFYLGILGSTLVLNNFEKLSSLNNELGSYVNINNFEDNQNQILNVLDLMTNSLRNLFLSILYSYTMIFAALFIFLILTWMIAFNIFKKKSVFSNFKFSFRYFIIFLTWYIIFLILITLSFLYLPVTNFIFYALFFLFFFISYLMNFSIVSYLTTKKIYNSFRSMFSKSMISSFFSVLSLFLVVSVLLYLLNLVSNFAALLLSILSFLFLLLLSRFYILTLVEKYAGNTLQARL